MKSNAYRSRHFKNKFQSKFVNDFNSKKKKNKRDLFDLNHGKCTN